MSSEIVFLDPAIDIVSGEDALRFCGPGSSFAVKDVSGVASALAVKWRDGGVVYGEASTDDPHQKEAADEITELLVGRRMLRVGQDRPPHFDPSRHWIQHYASGTKNELPPVNLLGSGYLAARIKEHLSSVGIACVEGTSAQCLLAAFDTPDLDALRAANVRAHEQEQAFLPIWMERSTAFWGPMTLPGATGCLECRLHRSHANRGRADDLAAFDLSTLSSSSIVAEILAAFAVGEALRWALDAHIETDVGVGWHFNWLTNDLIGRRVLRLPRCPVCGVPAGGAE